MIPKCQKTWFYHFLETPTRAGLIVLPWSWYPIFWTSSTVFTSTSGFGIWKSASCLFGSNFSFSGLTATSPWRLKTCSSWLSVNLRPSNMSLLTPLPLPLPADTALLSTSATSSRSLQKFWIPKIFASSICFVSRLRMLSFSAMLRRYLSRMSSCFDWISAKLSFSFATSSAVGGGGASDGDSASLADPSSLELAEEVDWKTLKIWTCELVAKKHRVCSHTGKPRGKM